MRFFNLVEQLATYTHGTQSFAVGAAVPGRLAFSTLSTESGERLYYRAATADQAQWEIASGIWDGGTTLTRQNVMASSASGSAVNFAGEVTLSLIQPADSMMVIDSSDPTTQAKCFGDQAIAAGPASQAWGASSMAIGASSQVGSSSSPVDGATSIGPNAQTYHEGATAIGRNGYSFMKNAWHGVCSVFWSGLGFTSGATTNDLLASSACPALPTNSAFALEAKVVARRSSGEVYACVIRALVRRGGSGDAVVEGSPSVTEIAKSGGVTVTATVVALTGGEFAIRVTGAASQDWNWAGALSGVWV